MYSLACKPDNKVSNKCLPVYHLFLHLGSPNGYNEENKNSTLNALDQCKRLWPATQWNVNGGTNCFRLHTWTPKLKCPKFSISTPYNQPVKNVLNLVFTFSRKQRKSWCLVLDFMYIHIKLILNAAIKTIGYLLGSYIYFPNFDSISSLRIHWYAIYEWAFRLALIHGFSLITNLGLENEPQRPQVLK